LDFKQDGCPRNKSNTMRFLRLCLWLEDWTAKRTLNIRKRLKIGEIVECFKAHLESLVRSAETKGSVSIKKTGSPNQIRGTTRYRKIFTTLKEKLLQPNYYNIVLNYNNKSEDGIPKRRTST
jgi:hypothetical protein